MRDCSIGDVGVVQRLSREEYESGVQPNSTVSAVKHTQLLGVEESCKRANYD